MNAFMIAWKASRYLPVSVIRGIAGTGAWLAWVKHGKGVRRLEDNLNRVTGLEGRALRSLSRRGMASAARYYAETLELSRMPHDRIEQRVRCQDLTPIHEIMRTEGRLVIVLGHSANWDLVGGFTARNVGPVISVAEILKPPEVFEAFLKLREDLGIRILGHEGPSTFRKLVQIGITEGGITALLADRDLSGDGVEVLFAGHRARVAPGPAALALTINAPLVPLAVRYERLHGARRRAAKSRWGLVMEFGPFFTVPQEGTKHEKVKAMSTEWAAWLGERVQRNPEDWHMLQRFGWIDGEAEGTRQAARDGEVARD
jgi:KDO2-lipid IV(A) lauroyltransferase